MHTMFQAETRANFLLTIVKKMYKKQVFNIFTQNFIKKKKNSAKTEVLLFQGVKIVYTTQHITMK